MKTIVSIIVACLMPCFVTNAQTGESDIRKQIIGTWLAGETFMPQPPPDMQQDIKTITFETNGIVKWSAVNDGKMREISGRYEVFIDEHTPRNLPSIFVAPTNYVTAGISSVCLLRLTEITIDLDERFNPDKVGKTLKAKGSDGKQLVFVRKR